MLLPLGIAPSVLDILSHFFGNILPSTFANLHILLHHLIFPHLSEAVIYALSLRPLFERNCRPRSGHCSRPTFDDGVYSCLVAIDLFKDYRVLNTGWTVRPEILSRSRNHTYSSQNLMKLAGQVKWVHLRVCKNFLANIPDTLVKYQTFYGSLLLQWGSSVSPTKWREI